MGNFWNFWQFIFGIFRHLVSGPWWPVFSITLGEMVVVSFCLMFSEMCRILTELLLVTLGIGGSSGITYYTAF